MVRTWIYCFRLTGWSLPEFASLYSVTQFCLVSLALHAYALPLISGNLTVELTDLAWCSFSAHHFLFLNSYEINTRGFICLDYQNGQVPCCNLVWVIGQYCSDFIWIYCWHIQHDMILQRLFIDLLFPTVIRLTREILLSTIHECTYVQCETEKYRTAIWPMLFRFEDDWYVYVHWWDSGSDMVAWVSCLMISISYGLTGWKKLLILLLCYKLLPANSICCVRLVWRVQ